MCDLFDRNAYEHMYYLKHREEKVDENNLSLKLIPIRFVFNMRHLCQPADTLADKSHVSGVLYNLFFYMSV